MIIHDFDAYVPSLKCADCVCVVHPFRSPHPDLSLTPLTLSNPGPLSL